MHEIPLSADELIKSLLNLEKDRNVCILDSCGVSYLGSHLLIAGFNPVETLEINETDPEKTLEILDKKLSQPDLSAIFTISYEFGMKLNKITPRRKEFTAFPEPDIFLALFDCLVIHDYTTGKTFLTGNKKHFDEIEITLLTSLDFQGFAAIPQTSAAKLSSNFTRESYQSAVKQVQEFIRRGDTYQTNLTQQLRTCLPENLTPEQIFLHLRQNHPAPFASFLHRTDDVVISASPERFFKVAHDGQRTTDKGQLITVSPIKGTRHRGKNELEDEQLKNELLNSEKDRAENIMIVDLLRNDIGRVCKFGSVKVEKLCDLETHPTLFHLVSTISGELIENTKFSDIIRATFPCGSITGAPKIRTMQLIDELETAPRGLSMGAIGFSVGNEQGDKKVVSGRWRSSGAVNEEIGGLHEILKSKNKEFSAEQEELQQESKNNDNPTLTTVHRPPTTFPSVDLSVAIRTMVIRNNEAIFNVGGGIIIDSDPEKEYEETLTKAKALLNALRAKNR